MTCEFASNNCTSCAENRDIFSDCNCGNSYFENFDNQCEPCDI